MTEHEKGPRGTRIVPPGELLRELETRAAPRAARRRAKRSVGHRFGMLGALATGSLLMMGLVLPALAVHDEGFQLEGNAAAADLDYTDIDKTGNQTTTTDGTLSGPQAGAYDWDSLIETNADGTGKVKASLPGNFVDAGFSRDFKFSGNTFLTSDDTTFATGSKDTLDIPDWQCNQDNNVNSKTDIANGYAAILEQNGQRFLYFGMEKDVDNGDNNVGIWLLQDPEVGCESTGGAVDFTGAHVPGDLFIVSEFTNGGGVSAVTAYQWVADADPKAGLQPGIDPTPVAQSADCLDIGLTGDVDRLCAAVNGRTITMPWKSVDGGVINAPKVSPNFFEGGIELSAFPTFANSCFTGFLFSTRSSQELGANLFDYVMGDIDTCAPDLSLVKTPDSGTHFVGDSFDWNIVVSNTGDGAAKDAVVSDTIASGLQINSATVQAPGVGSCSINGQVVTCTVDVPVAGSITIHVNVTVLAGAVTDQDGCNPVNNSATVTGDEDTSNNTDTGQIEACRLAVTKTATTTYDRDFDWTIDKSVDPTSASLFDGQTADFGYSVTATKSAPIDSNFAVSGNIVISNPASIAATLTSVTDDISGVGAVTVTCPNLTVPAAGTLTCTYSSALPNKDARTNTATATQNNGTQYQGQAAVTFGDPTNVSDNGDSVDDTINAGDFGPFTSTTTHTYQQTYDCSGVSYTNGVGTKTIHNVATLVDDGDSDFADVTITCYRLSVSKSATTTYDRDFDWTIDKSVDPTSASLFDGQTANFGYSVTATKGAPADTNFAVSGNIVVSNPATMAATLTSVTDSISGIATAVTVSCPSMTVPAGGTLTCTYSKALPDKTSRTNTATAVAYGVSYQGQAAITFGEPTNVSDNGDSVDDTINAGDFGPFTSTTTHTYQQTYDCSGVQYTNGVGTKTIHNVATLVNDGDSDFADVTITCYRLGVEKSATTTYDRDFDWTIDKSVNPTSASLFDGQTADFGYSVTATKSAPIDSNFAVSGNIVISNPAPMAATVTSVTDSITGIGAVSVSCPASTIAAGGTLTCTYSKTLPDKTSRTNTATAIAYGVSYSDDAAVTFGDPTNVSDNGDSVDDTINAGDFGPFTSTTTHTYQQTYDCSGVSYTNGVGTKTIHNVATLVDDGDSDFADVTITCYRLSVSKSATTTYDRDFDWTIDKSADQTSLILAEGQSFIVNYSVAVTRGAADDSNFAVSGNIVVSNPATMAATLTSVTDSISGIGAVTVTCPNLTVPAGGTLTCTYSSALPDKTSRTNTATAVAYGVSYQGQADITFGDPANVTDECVDLSDTFAGALGTVCASGTTTKTYTRDVGQAVCGEYDIPNTASFVTNDNKETGSDGWTVHVSIPCPTGCTLTQGYWKTHSELGPAPYDDAWALLDALEGSGNPLVWAGDGSFDKSQEPFFYPTNGATWYDVFWTAPAGNAYYQLAHQYEAAVLNILNDADAPTTVTNAIAHAEALFEQYTPSYIGGLKGNNAIRKDFVNTAAILASYNTGAIGPGHCDEDSLSSKTP